MFTWIPAHSNKPATAGCCCGGVSAPGPTAADLLPQSRTQHPESPQPTSGSDKGFQPHSPVPGHCCGTGRPTHPAPPHHWNYSTVQTADVNSSATFWVGAGWLCRHREPLASSATCPPRAPADADQRLPALACGKPNIFASRGVVPDNTHAATELL